MKQVFYHAGCNDGTTAASIVLHTREWRDAKAIPVKYGEQPPSTTSGDEIMIVDFSYPRPILETINRLAKSLVVLDHHQTAEAELKDLPFCRFEKDKCGAMMTWDFFTLSSKHPPHGLEMIQDRDLWTKRWPEETEAFTAGLGLLENKPGENWYRAVMENWHETTERGKVAVEVKRRQIERLIPNAVPAQWRGERIGVSLNSPVHQSDLGEELLKLHPQADYALIWYVDGEDRKVSLRSRNGGPVDVSEMAKQHGGGGHKHAAGYTIKGGG